VGEDAKRALSFSRCALHPSYRHESYECVLPPNK
jgi:hypothetical protein